MTKIKLDCGCQFEQNNGNLIIDYNLDNVNFDCPKVWELISSGKTIGLFQIDSYLGQAMSKRLKPENISHLAALISIMRPSCLKGCLDDGISIAEHYIKRKNKEEEPIAPYECLKEILKNTYGLSLYQEDLINIAKEVAGFSLVEADLLRKSIGKKRADIMSVLKKQFIDGCVKVGKVNKKEAGNIFSWCEASQRYSFNFSHAVSYATTTFLTAIPKAHDEFRLRFYKSWLNHSQDKIKPLDEIKNLVIDAKSFGIDIINPDIREKNIDFKIKDGRIVFGLGHVKGVGEKSIQELFSVLANLMPLKITQN